MQIPGLQVKLDEDAVAWRSTRHPGIDWCPLDPAPTDGASKERGPRDTSALIRMQPGCGYPRHRHLDVEQVLILRGGYRDAHGEHHAGAWLRYEADSEHAPVALGRAGDPACLLLAVARGGVLNLD